jgi:RNA 2',3'-cyclic 3'-phosphodiesterase
VTKKFALRAHCRQDVCAPSVQWRVFCAIGLPENTRRLVLQHITDLRAAATDAKASWARDGNLHLTLKFLGEIPRSSVTCFSNAVSQAVAELAPFSIQLGHTGVFPKRGEPRVLWIGVNDISGKLSELHARLEDESLKAGFEKEKRAFHPHLTIARLRRRQHASELAQAHLQMTFEPVEILVNELLVIRSELSSAGSKYTVVSRHALSGVW